MPPFRAFRSSALVLLLSVSGALASAAGSTTKPPGQAISRPLPARTPVMFEENRGQTLQETKYLTRTSEFTLLVNSTELVWLFPNGTVEQEEPGPVVRMECFGRSDQAQPTASEPLITRTSYIRGSDPQKWTTGIRNYRRVQYPGIYPGVDLLLRGQGSRIEYDFVLAPGADPSRIQLRFTGIEAARIGSAGQLVLDTTSGQFEHSAPRVYQTIDGMIRPLTATYRLLENGMVGFEVEEHDRSRELVIDPVLTYSTYFGGTRDEVPGGASTDSEGNLYIVGSTGSLDFPIQDPFQEEFSGGGTPNGDVFVTKLDPTGSTVIYSTYIGGTGTDLGVGIAVDSGGRAVITGTTFSGNFPSTPGSFQPVCGGQCPFVAKLTPDGTDLVYATFVGRGHGRAVAVDSQGRALVTGQTTSQDFPLVNAFQPERGGASEAFVTSVSSNGTSLIFSTFLGGSGEENLTGRQGIAVDPSDNVLVVGRTDSDDFPTLNPVQATLGGEDDVFVARFTPQGNLLFATYLGGSSDDQGQAIVSDTEANFYITGNTRSDDFPTTVGAFQTEYGGGIAIGDALVAKFSPGGALLFSTYLGGQAGDTGGDIALDAEGRVTVVGNASSNFPVLDPFVQFDGIRNYVAKLSNDGTELVYSTPIGGGDADVSVATWDNAVYVAGNIATGTLPLLNSLQPLRAGGTDLFLAQIVDASEFFFAHFGNGTGAVSDILLTNPSAATPTNATVTFRGDDGLPVELGVTISGDQGLALQQQAPTSEVNVSVAPLGAVRITTDGIGDIVTGSVTVAHDNPLGGVLRFNLTPFGNAGVAASERVRGFITSVRKTSINTGVAVYNPLDKAVGIRLRLRDLDGQEIAGGLRTLTLDPREHLAQFIDELFRNANLENFEGTLTVEATSLDSVITGTALELGPQPGQFTTLPIVPVP